MTAMQKKTTPVAVLLALAISAGPVLAQSTDEKQRRRYPSSAEARERGEGGRAERADAGRQRGGSRTEASQPSRGGAWSDAAANQRRATPRGEAPRQEQWRNDEAQREEARRQQAERNRAADRRRDEPRRNDNPRYEPRSNDAPRYEPRRNDAPRYDPRRNDAPRYEPRRAEPRAYGGSRYGSRYDSRYSRNDWRYDGRYYRGTWYSNRPFVMGSYYPSYRPGWVVRFGLGFSVYAGSPFAYRLPYGYTPPYAYRYPVRTGIAYGGMSFLIDPDDAEVYVDGVFIGYANEFGGQPVPVSAGYHRIEIYAPGYEGVVYDVNVLPGQVIPYRGSLVPAYGW